MSLQSLRYFLALSLLVISFHSFAQPMLWGMTTEGGPTGSGVIFKLRPNGSSYTVVHTLEAEEGGGAIGAQGMVLASDGLFYGTTNRGGLHDMGTLFSYDPASHAYHKKIDFSTAIGAYPFGALMQASNGKIYGTTQWEGLNGYGTFFEYDLTTNVLQVKLAWETGSGMANGSFGVIEGDDGLLYGIRSNWGSSRKGVIFRYNPTSQLYEERYHFTDDTNGRTPLGVLTKLDDGTFLGVTETGGTNNNGTVYHYNPTTNSLWKKADVAGIGSGAQNGAYPVGFLTKHSNGKFYGLTQSGGTVPGNVSIGTLFEYDHTTGIYTLKFSFSSPNGIRPSGKLIAAADGKLYGKTNEGGTHADEGGTFFSFDPSGNTFNKIKDFGGDLGSKPYGSLELEPNGKVLGSTSEGAQGDNGVLFEYDIASGDLLNVRDMNYAPEGAAPYGSFVMDPSGKLMATLSAGGGHGKGVIFQIDPATSEFVRIADFDGMNGAEPVGELVLADNGKYYGMTRKGGDNNLGVIFQFDYETKDLVAVFHFDGTNGSHPGASLTKGSNGILFGVTPGDGDNGQGTIFTFNTLTSEFIKIHDFISATGSAPEAGGLSWFTDHKLYGVTLQGGLNGRGVIYRIDPATGSYDKMYDFNSDNGYSSFGDLLVTSDGKMLGLASSGGQSDAGVIFQFNPASGEYVVLKNLNTQSGKYPRASLTEGANGMVYAMTSGGGAQDLGTVFRFQISNGAFSLLKSFDLTNGAEPTQNKLLMVKGNQQVDFDPQQFTYKSSAVVLAGAASSGLVLSYESSDPAIASVQGNLITMHRTGSVTIIASQPGNPEYNPAAPVEQVVTIMLGNPTATSATEISEIGFTANWNTVEGAQSYVLDISADDFATFIPGYEHKPVTGLSETVTGLLPDTPYKYRLKAIGEFENSGYSNIAVAFTTLPPAAPTAREAKDITTTGFTAQWNEVLAASGYVLDVSADQFLTFIPGYESKAALPGEVITGLTASTIYQYRVRALNTGGTSSFSNIITVTTSPVPKRAQKITFDIITDKTKGGADFKITAVSDSGLPVLFTSQSSTINLENDQVKISKAGKTKIVATQAGNELYLAAEPVEQTFCVLPAIPKISSSGESSKPVLISDASEGNQWYFNGEVAGGEQRLTVTKSGSYTVTVTADGCSSASVPFIVDIPVVTGLDKEQLSEIKVYPNPAKDVIQILTPQSHTYRLRIIQSGGQISIDCDAYHSGEEIDLSKVPSGISLIEITHGKQRYTTKLVKN